MNIKFSRWLAHWSMTLLLGALSIPLFLTLPSKAIPGYIHPDNRWMLQRNRTNLCLNAYRPYNSSLLNLWQCNTQDGDQWWQGILLSRGNRDVWMFRRVGTNHCLNAHRPRNGSLVNLWRCDPNDPDQLWHWEGAHVNQNTFRRKGTNFCLNAYRPHQRSRLTMWQCDPNDGDQAFRDASR